jgi:4-hydroxybenzoate polyprenyltransferase
MEMPGPIRSGPTFPGSSRAPLCVDLDGALVAADTLWESLLTIARRNPFALIPILAALFRGKERFKAAVASRSSINVGCLPYRTDLLRYLREQKAAGRRLVLVTAAHRSIAEAVASHLGLFDEIIAATGRRNLHGTEALSAKFGDAGFSYAGAAAPSVARRIGAPVEVVFGSPNSRFRTVLGAVRLHQWTKNLLVFVPLFTSRDLHNLPAAGMLLMTALALSLIASAQYLINDLIDLESDRRHSKKRRRALASGALPIPWALLLIPALLVAGGGVAYLAGGLAALELSAAYFITSIAYSSYLKTRPLVDVFILAGLYVLRIVIGGAVSDHQVTVWLLSFSFLSFLGLAFLKRYVETARMNPESGRHAARRGYYAGDAPILGAMGVASGFAAAVVLILYVFGESANALYRRPFALWGLVPICLLLHCRLWLSGWRGYIDEDPVRYVLRDRVTWACGALAAAVYYGAIGGLG